MVDGESWSLFFSFSGLFMTASGTPRAQLCSVVVALVACVSLAAFHCDLPPRLLSMHTWLDVEEKNSGRFVNAGRCFFSGGINPS